MSLLIESNPILQFFLLSFLVRNIGFSLSSSIRNTRFFSFQIENVIINWKAPNIYCLEVSKNSSNNDNMTFFSWSLSFSQKKSQFRKKTTSNRIYWYSHDDFTCTYQIFYLLHWFPLKKWSYFKKNDWIERNRNSCSMFVLSTIFVSFCCTFLESIQLCDRKQKNNIEIELFVTRSKIHHF